MNYYAISDIHGYLNELKETMKLVDLKSNNKLIFLGDYIDYGKNSCEVLYYIKNLQEKYKEKVVVLKGNHEELFLKWIFNPKEYINYFIEDKNFYTLKTFLDVSKIDFNKDITLQSIFTANLIMIKHNKLIKWMKKLPYYYETDKQIFVHAGINEEMEKLWKLGTPKYYFIEKYPNTLSNNKYFYKDIIAGHIGSSQFRDNKDNHNVFWDGKSHFYIDGTVTISSFIPILKYDTIKCVYTSFNKIDNKWIEYKVIKKS